jgi:hypothetical protein
MNYIDNYLARTEQLLNPVDWIPYASSFSGMVRILTGGVETIAGMALAYIRLTGALFEKNWKWRWKAELNEGLTYSFHGLANMIRGAIAMCPGLNLVLFFHDQQLGRFNYPFEKIRSGVYPLANIRYSS